MARTILVPTDFSIRSLHTLRHAFDERDTQQLDIVFFAGFVLTESITELLFFSRRRVIDSVASGDFKEACQIIRNRYSSQINGIRFEIFTGFTQAAFNNFVEGNGIDEIYIPVNKLNYPRQCFDPTAYMQKSTLPKIVVSWTDAPESKQQNHLSELFTSWI